MNAGLGRIASLFSNLKFCAGCNAEAVHARNGSKHPSLKPEGVTLVILIRCEVMERSLRASDFILCFGDINPGFPPLYGCPIPFL